MGKKIKTKSIVKKIFTIIKDNSYSRYSYFDDDYYLIIDYDHLIRDICPGISNKKIKKVLRKLYKKIER